MAGPLQLGCLRWGGGVYCIVCVFLFAAVFVFLLVSRLGIRVVSCSSQLVFDVFIGVHGLALIRVRFLFLMLCPPPCPGGRLCTTGEVHP